ncbi:MULTISPECIES: helix-turn-helix domain-containing protein [Streptomyces]|uniref:Transposase IS204/IS1001/IS1096/IS1165 helix-turn-helix domain-containing protein n=1 Tax=Streptomyces sviceus (strain ATCC 29083 / DSM 924 / JCM 4929 / NBRC 13980 / NCIMB 11184 / NRRL 5439 / UC 5370) TaxID=463191 RepID=B5HS25_STRX2|nr:helix-turn-helix domain-containing protein [Streptomyces sp. CC0208]EDY55630.1 conserved hypothetical protein [Streptomyces sviceus ATCC 29083]MYT03141.1 hypothetical protein [Streptomyces sp. SID5470]
MVPGARLLRRSFTERVPQLPAGARITVRLRGAAGRRIRDAASTVIEAARDLHLSWPTVMDAFRARRTRGDRGTAARGACLPVRTAVGLLAGQGPARQEVVPDVSSRRWKAPIAQHLTSLPSILDT